MAPKKMLNPILTQSAVTFAEANRKGSSSHIPLSHSRSISKLPGSSTNRSTGRSIPWADLPAPDPNQLPTTEATAGPAQRNQKTINSGTVKQNPPVISRDWKTSENRVQRSVDTQTANGRVSAFGKILPLENRPGVFIKVFGGGKNEFKPSVFHEGLGVPGTVFEEGERGFRIEFEDSDRGRAAPGECYKDWHYHKTQGCTLEIKVIDDWERHFEEERLYAETSKRNPAVLNTSEGANRRRDSINARIEPAQTATDELNPKNSKRGEFVRANHGDDSDIDHDKARSDNIMHLLKVYQAVQKGSGGRSKIAVNDDAASSISGLTTSDTSRSKKATCHICQQNISTGSAIEVKCSTCSRRYHSHCLRDKDTMNGFEMEMYQCRRCVQKGVKAAPSTSSTSRDPDGKAVKRRKLENEPSSTARPLTQPQRAEDDQDAIEVRHWSNKAIKPITKTKAPMGPRSTFESSAASNGDEAAPSSLASNGTNLEKAFSRERLPRAPAQRPVTKPSGSKGRITKRPSKTELVPCGQCKTRNVPLLPSGQPTFCPECKSSGTATGGLAQLRKTQAQGKATEPVKRTQSDGVDPSTSIQSDPAREASEVIEHDHSSKSKSPLPIANANDSDVASPKEPSIAAPDDESAEACRPSVTQERGLSHAGDSDAGQDAIDTNDCCIGDSIPVKTRLKPGMSRDSTKAATSTECSSRSTCESTVAYQSRKSRDPDLGRPDIDIVMAEPVADDAAQQRVPSPQTCSSISPRLKSRLKSRLSDEEGRGLCYSLFTELPELDPKNQTHWADKMEEINSRLRRKDLMEKSTLYSPLGMKKIVDTRRAAKRSMMEPAAPATENSEQPYIESTEDDGRKVHAYQSLDEFLGGLEERDVVTVREREVCYRDGIRKNDGTFARTRNAYPTGV